MAVRLRSIARNDEGIATAVAILKQRFGERCHTGEAGRTQHGHTTTWIANEAPDAVVYAHERADVEAIVEICRAHGVPIVPFGVGTSREGHVNAPAGGVSVDFSEMAAVLEVYDEDLACRVQPGVTRKKLNETLRDRGLLTLRIARFSLQHSSGSKCESFVSAVNGHWNARQKEVHGIPERSGLDQHWRSRHLA